MLKALIVMIIIFGLPIYFIISEKIKDYRKNRPKSDEIWLYLENNNSLGYSRLVTDLKNKYSFSTEDANSLVICWRHNEIEQFLKVCRQHKRIKIIK